MEKDKDAKSIESPPAKPKPAPTGAFFRYNSASDRCLVIIGSIAALLQGLSIPSIALLFGMMTDSFQDGSTAFDDIRKLSLMYFFVALVIFFLSYVYFTFWIIISQNIGAQYRQAYLKGILKQDIKWFDTNDPLELPSKLSKDCVTIQNGVGEKFAQLLVSSMMSIGGFLVAFVKGWKLALALLAMFPLMSTAGAMFTKIAVSGYVEMAGGYAKSGGYAE